MTAVTFSLVAPKEANMPLLYYRRVQRKIEKMLVLLNYSFRFGAVTIRGNSTNTVWIVFGRVRAECAGWAITLRLLRSALALPAPPRWWRRAETRKWAETPRWRSSSRPPCSRKSGFWPNRSRACRRRSECAVRMTPSLLRSWNHLSY